jgi:Cu(I)/Ag(I) efflux system protein CusF
MNKCTQNALALACLSFLTALAMAQSEMKKMDMPVQPTVNQQTAHMAQGIVKAVNVKGGEVTIAHGPIKTLNWPAMTMSFMVQNQALFKKLVVGKKIDFEIIASGKDYLVTSVK